MACDDLCCPPHNFDAIEDPTVNDCNNSTVPSYVGGYCPGSYWYNNTTGVLWVGANDMACGSALWINLNPSTVHVKAKKATEQDIPHMTFIPITFLVEDYDADNLWDGTTFTPADNGFYMVSSFLGLSPLPDSPDTQNTFNLEVWVNGAFESRLSSATSDVATGRQSIAMSGSRTMYLSAGDTLQIICIHDAKVTVQTSGHEPNGRHGEITIDQLV